MKIQTRTARQEDLEKLSKVHNAAWQLEHKNNSDPKVVKDNNGIFNPLKQESRKRKILFATMYPRQQFFAVAVVNYVIVGFCEATRPSCNSEGSKPVFVQRLYVDPKYHKTGVAAKLVADLLSWLDDGEQ